MKHRRTQWAAPRSRLVHTQTRLYRFLAIAVLGIILGITVLLPLTAAAQSLPNKVVSSSNQNVLASSIATAKVQVPPSVVNRLRQALSKQTSIPAAKLKVVEATPKTWTDGCFGLARSGEICTQALIKGSRVVLSNGSQRWIYRTDQQGRAYRLES